MKKLEIDITHNCTLQCFNCDRGLSLLQGNKNTTMELAQIKRFVDQSISCGQPWEQIRIMGGEPTIHHEFNEIIHIMYEYKREYNPSLRLIVSSNGYTAYTKRKLLWLEENYPDIIIENTNKVDNYQQGFNLIHYAVCDIHNNPNYEYKGCWTTEACAISLNASGFYCCAVGGAIDKFFKYNIGIKDLAEVNVENLSKMFNPLCSKCGRYQQLQVDNNNIEVVVSATWKKCLENFDESDCLDRY
ncbi:radical SAM protein ['Paenibacillus yunnanensis' Narsing Rao et al. 2020]|uniref:radical SAM protein n=1 Tax=Paenibacillus tengchongensis TaxID=2608684 RepID=UPI00165245A7|nr:radical SAM protein [Paenibacillus tengchongensis]